MDIAQRPGTTEFNPQYQTDEKERKRGGGAFWIKNKVWRCSQMVVLAYHA